MLKLVLLLSHFDIDSTQKPFLRKPTEPWTSVSAGEQATPSPPLLPTPRSIGLTKVAATRDDFWHDSYFFKDNKNQIQPKFFSDFFSSWKLDNQNFVVFWTCLIVALTS